MKKFFSSTLIMKQAKNAALASMIALGIVALPTALWSQQPTVHLEPLNLNGPLPLQKRTAQAVIRDYLESWQSMSTALDQNRADLLDADFVGLAHKELAKSIQQQAALGLHTHYQDVSHDVRIVFYSPDGMSVQLTDDVEYQQQIFASDKSLTTQQAHVHYIVVLTPAELRWRVRIFQAEPQAESKLQTQ